MTRETYRALRGRERKENPGMALFSQRNRVFAGRKEKIIRSQKRELRSLQKAYGC